MRYLVIAILVLAGCSIGRHGETEVTVPEGPKASLKTPSDPKTPSTTEVSRTVVRKYVPFTRATVEASPVGQQPSATLVEETTTEKGPANALVEETITDSAKTIVSGSWFSETKAKLEALKWLQWVGIACLLFAAAMFYAPLRTVIGAGKSMQVAVALAGVALIFGPVIVVGNETIILLAVFGFVAWHYMTARLEYKSGQLDANKNGIPDDKE